MGATQTGDEAARVGGSRAAAGVCPACAAVLPGRPRGLAPACPSCGAAFRSPLTGALLSVVLPGWGHFYLRRRALAAVELGVGLILFGMAMVNLAVVFVRVVQEEAPLLDLLRACPLWALVLASYSAIDGLFTWAVSRRRAVLVSPPGPRP